MTMHHRIARHACHRPRRLAAAALLALPLTTLAALPAAAGWTLDGKASSLHFVSVKKGTVGEVHRFRELAGTIGDDGQAKVEIVLDSVDTRVPIRDERMRKMLFETEKYPRAVATATIDPALLKGLKPGRHARHAIALKLELHGRSKEYAVPVTLVGLENGAVLVAATRPVIVNAATFGLEPGVEALRKVVNLPSIAQAVPVTFELVFRPAGGSGEK